MQKKIVLFSSKNILGSLFESNVIEFLKAINQFDQNIKLCLLFFKGKITSEEQEMIFFKNHKELTSFINHDSIQEIKKYSLINMFSHYQRLVSLINSSPNSCVVLFCQNYYASFIGSFVKQKYPKVHFHVSLKGVVPEEQLKYGASNFLINILHYLVAKYFEKIFVKKADSFSVVSTNFKKYLINKYGISKKIIVFPSAFNHKVFFYDQALRKITRAKLDILPGETILTYSGSFQKWQNPEILFSFFSKVLERNPKLKLLIITYHNEKALQLIKQHNISLTRAIIKTGDASEVNAWLNASDICTLFREDDLVNQVASPTKFLEYVATRNKIIMTDNIGDFSVLIKNTNYGLISPNLKLETLLNLFTQIEQIDYPSEDFIQQVIQKYSTEASVKLLLSSFHFS